MSTDASQNMQIPAKKAIVTYEQKNLSTLIMAITFSCKDQSIKIEWIEKAVQQMGRQCDLSSIREILVDSLSFLFARCCCQTKFRNVPWSCSFQRNCDISKRPKQLPFLATDVCHRFFRNKKQTRFFSSLFYLCRQDYSSGVS